MSDQPSPLGRIGWTDLTVPDAEAARRFYEAVVGWTAEPIDMGGYSDFCMKPSGSSDVVAGVCHARDENADLPPVWLIYVTVPDIEASTRKVTEMHGQILRPIRSSGSGKMCVIRDPAGAILALYQPI
jgi:predicted enzyme related to lactoylglutathione lyase